MKKKKPLPRSLRIASSNVYDAVWVFAREWRKHGGSASDAISLVLAIFVDESEVAHMPESKGLKNYFKRKGLK